MYTGARRYMRVNLLHDLVAGLTGATAGVPQAMGFAMLAGINPVYGLYTAIVSTIVAALVGDSAYMTTGPTNALALVLGGTLAAFGDSGDVVTRLISLTMLVGIIQLAFGLLRLGGLTRYVSNAVMTGFITGAALLIIIGQLRHLTGIATSNEDHTFKALANLVDRADTLNLATLVIGLVTTVLILVLHRTRFKSFASLFAISITSVWVALAGWEGHGVALVSDLSAIPNRLPGVTLPDFSLAREMAGSALAIALLGLVQAAALAQSLALQRDENHINISRDFVGQGAANVIGAFYKGMPAGGSLSRTAVNISAGARTRLANVFAGVFVALTTLLLGGLAERIALAALAGHLVVAALSLITPEQIRFIWLAGKPSRAAMLVTFLSTLIFPLEYSVYVGVVLSLVLYVGQSSHLQIVQLEPEDHTFREVPLVRHLPDRQPVILQIQGNLFFAAMRDLQERLPDPAESRQPVVILRLRGDELLAGTGAAFLMAYARQLRSRQGKLILCGVGDQVTNTLEHTGALSEIGAENVFHASDTLLTSTQHAVEYARAWLDEHPA